MNISTGVKNWKNANILTLDVPPELERTVRTGVEFVDKALGSDESQGSTPSSSILLTGTPGAGKTTLTLQIADALTGRGHIAIVATGEESLYQVRKTTKRLKCKNGFVASQDSHIPTIIKLAKKLQVENKGRKTPDGEPVQVVVIVDSLGSANDGFYRDGTVNSCSQVRVIEQLTSWAKDTFGIAICIGHVTKGNIFAGKNTIKHAVDVHAHLFIDDEKKSETFGERIFEIQKNRFGVAGTRYIVGLEASGMYLKGEYTWTA